MDKHLHALELQILSQPQQAELTVQALLTQARRDGDPHSEAYALCILADCAFFQDKYADTLDHAWRAGELSHRHGFTDLEARSHGILGLALWRLGQLTEAMEHAHYSLALGADDLLACNRALSCAAVIHAELGDHERALENFRRAAEMASRSQRPEEAAPALTGTIWTMLHLGRLEALELVPEVRALAERHGMTWVLGTLSFLEARLLHRLGRLSEGRERAEAGLAQAQQAGSPEAQGFLCHVLADLHMATGNLALACGPLEQGEQIAQRLGHMELYCLLKYSRANLYQLIGNERAALNTLKEYLDLCEKVQASRQQHNRTVSQQVSLELLQRGAALAEHWQHAATKLSQAEPQSKYDWMRPPTQNGAAELRRQRLQADLHHALARGECELHYQPQFSLPGGQLIGLEALLRWRHPELGMITPAEFIPLAEENLLILELGTWALREACCQAQAWNLGAHGMIMSVNVSVRQFERPDFVLQVESALAACGLPGNCLMLELTETLLHQEALAGAQTVRDLHRLGVHIAIDDFGTGYSNMQLLRNLPFRQLKIDRSFVQDLSDQSNLTSARHFMEVMLNLAHGLGIQVVAEGVETQQQFDLLSHLGCDKAQGFFLSRPLPAQQVAATFLRPCDQDRFTPEPAPGWRAARGGLAGDDQQRA